MAKRRCKKYYYVPSTYKGKKFKRKGKCGGAYRGCGRICGGNLDDLAPRRIAEAMPTFAASAPVDIPVEPTQVENNILSFPKITPEMIERARQVIALAEATGQAQPITKQEAGIWSGLKNLGSKVWSGVKTVASNPYVQGAVKAAVPFALGALAPAAMPYVQKAADYLGQNAYDYLGQRYKTKSIFNQSAGENMKDIAKNTGALVKNVVSDAGQTVVDTGKNVVNAILESVAPSSGDPGLMSKAWSGFRGLFKRGSGYRAGAYRGCGRKGHLRKGSPEAKAYMAMLRRMRGKKKGKGIGGAYRGCGRKGHLRKGSPEAKAYMAMLRRMRGKKKSSKKGGMFRGVPLDKIRNYYHIALNNPDHKATVHYLDENGKTKVSKVTANSLEAMIRGTTNIQNFYKFDENGKKRDSPSKFRGDFLVANRGKRRWPYKALGIRRMKKFFTHLKSLKDKPDDKKRKRFESYWKTRASPLLAEQLISRMDMPGKGTLNRALWERFGNPPVIPTLPTLPIAPTSKLSKKKKNKNKKRKPKGYSILNPR